MDKKKEIEEGTSPQGELCSTLETPFKILTKRNNQATLVVGSSL